MDIGQGDAAKGQSVKRFHKGGASATRVSLSVWVAMAMMAALLAVVVGHSSTANADTIGPNTGCTPNMNPVQCENLQPGTPVANSPMSISYQSVGDPTIQGFATSMSVNLGQTVSFKVSAPGVSAWHINIFRMGYYQGLGAREWASNILPSVSLPQSQPTCAGEPRAAR